jgi:hypothetical protein
MEQKKITFSNNNLSLLLAILSIAIVVILKIVASFGALYLGTLFGIFYIVILVLPIAGAIIAYSNNKNLLSFELLFNLATLVLALLVF